MQTDLLANILAWHASERPSTEALVTDSTRLTYQELARDVAALAARWRDLGVVAGDRIALDLPNSIEWVETLFAAAYVGATVVPVNPTLGYHELKYQLRHANVQVAVVSDHEGALDYLEFFEELIAELPELQYLVMVGDTDFWYDDRIFQFSDLIQKGRRLPTVAAAEAASSSLALVYTSGTMGKPKGVLLSEENLLSTARPTCEILGLVDTDRVLAAVPFFTIFGIHVIVSTLAAGATLVIQKHFDRAAVLDLIEGERLTVVHGVPTMFELLMRESSFSLRDLSSCRTGIIAGSPVAPVLVDRVRTWCDVQIAYGLTETGPTISMTRSEDPAGTRRATVGRPLEGIVVKLIRREKNDEDGIDEDAGELAVSGPNVMLGYYRMPGETAKTLTPDGFFRTGDLAVIDADGYIRIVGRQKEMIIRGGHNIYPRELEDLLRTHPAVEQVCVIGVPNDVLGELVCACVVLIEGAVATADDLTSYLAEQVAAFKVPDLVRFLDEIPRTQSGKVKHHELIRPIVDMQQNTTGDS